MNACMKKVSKKDLIEDIIRAYEHDVISEGATISKRRLWYILKPSFTAVDLSEVTSKGQQVKPIDNADFNKYFNSMAKAGEIDDTYILDNSRTMQVGSRLPHIIIVAEKKTIETTALNLAEKLGVSCYIAGGFSAVYGAKKLLSMIRETSTREITILMMSDYDKSGMHIQDTSARHFDTSKIYRVLLEPHQVPSTKTGEYFKISPTGERFYELDVLNIHELVDVFMNNIPAHISIDIKAHFKQALEYTVMQNELLESVDNHPDVIALEEKLRLLKESLFSKYESTFIDANPIKISPFTEQDIYDGTVDYSVDEWMVSDE